MPQILQTADQIARDHEQDILLVDFRTPKQRREGLANRKWDHEARSHFIAWCDRQGIKYEECFPPIGPGSGWITPPFFAQLAVVASEERQPDLYRKIVRNWEQEDGRPKVVNVTLFVVAKDMRRDPEGRQGLLAWD